MILNFSNDLQKDMAEAEVYEDWKRAAIKYDKKYRLDHWKNVDQTRRYDYASIRTRLEALRSLRESKDDHGLLFALNEGIHGNMGGMGGVSLYKKAKFGTKQLIVEYVEEIVSALEYLSKPKVTSISLEEKMEFFQRASHCFGRSALLLSGAGSLLYFHLGVVKALWEQDILPSIISGSSGGSVIAALVGTHSHDELEKIFDPEFISMEVRQDVGLLKYFSLFAKKQIPVEEVRALIARQIPDMTFEEAYDLTGININISVAPAELHQTSRLLNAVTSPNVLVREAVLASCSVPGVYPPVQLAARNVKGKRQPYLPSRKWVDGSLTEDLPIKRLSRLYGVNHTIVSQTNPLVLPFINENKTHNDFWEIVKHTTMVTTKEWMLSASRLLQKPIGHNAFLNKLVNGYVSVVSQTYTGDINILPSRRVNNLFTALSPRSLEEALALVMDGEKSTWPNIERIRIQGRVSRALDKVLENFEHEIISSAERKDSSREKRA